MTFSKLKKTISKQELADLIGVSRATLMIWINRLYLEDLLKLGYKKRQRLFTPKQTSLLYKKLEIYESE